MDCFRPITIHGPDYSGPVPCGKCFACQSNRRKDWFLRIKYELFYSLQSFTVTLTYDDEHLPPRVPYHSREHVPVVSGYSDFDEVCNETWWYHPYRISDLQKFFKLIRKKYKFRYFAVAEYGSKRARPHYHVIFFFDYPVNKLSFTDDVFKYWKNGTQITVDDTTDDCIGYTLKYCLKPFTSIDPSPKVIMSKRPYIGYRYLTQSTVNYLRSQSSDVVNTIVGKCRLPRTLRDKVYDDEMKEVHKKALEDYRLYCEETDKRNAEKFGFSVEEYKQRKKDFFIDRIWNQIKKKTI